MTDTLVTISEDTTTRPEYILLQAGEYPPRQGPGHGRICSWHHLPDVLKSASQSQYVAVDLETKGGDYSGPIEIVGIGLAWDQGSVYFDWTELFRGSRESILNFLLTHQGLLFHNAYFDCGVIRSLYGVHPRPYACTYALLAMTANEGFPGEYWGLKGAQVNLLCWPSSNETELDEWLVVNGYYKGNRRIDNTPDYLRAEFQLGKLRPEKGEMWRAPVEILGKYCCLDAESTYLLFTEVLLPVVDKFPALLSFHQKEFLHLIQVLIDQKIHGIPMNRDGLFLRRSQIENEIRELSHQYRCHPEVEEWIQILELDMCKELAEKEPERLKKNGEVSKNWIKWDERYRIALEGGNPDYQFNLQSGPQLRDLYYEKLKYPVRIETEKGEPGVGIKALKHLGETGKLLIERMWLTKELSYIDKYIELTEHRDTIHPSFRSPGTVTGRLSSKEPNMQQIPKSKAMMDLFVTRPGTVWVDLDFSALEPVVTTEFTQDPNMLAIYGNGRPQNDIYLFVGASIPGEIGRKIRATGYDPLNPTPEALARAKKECKHERSICKTVCLACAYGAGVKKVNQTLEDQDIFLEYEEVEAIHSTYWEVFRDVKKFSKDLYFQWRKNGGYILNGIGRPMAVPEDMTQDLLNRFVQSTGHDILTKYVYILTQLLENEYSPTRGVWRPIIIDFHDATTIEVPEALAAVTVEIFDTAMVQLNEVLGGTIKLRGTAVVGRSLADVKEPEE